MNSDTKNKFLIIGLDGATFNLVKPWVREGKLPNLGKLMDEGVHGPLESTTPPISSAAWVSFMTGMNPGSHGVFKFSEFNSNNYYKETEYIPITSEKFSGKTIFDIVSAYDYKAISIAVPLTYPAWEINGIMISGWPIPDNAGPERIFPRSLYTWRNQFPPYCDINFKERDKVIDKLLHNINRRFLQVKNLLEKEWDLFTVVLGETDQAQHYFWRYLDRKLPINTDSEYRDFKDVIFRVYSLIDKKLGEILPTLTENTQVIIMSDHGGCLGPTRILRLNHWLRSRGFLKSTFSSNLFLEPLKYMICRKYDKSKNNGTRIHNYWDTSQSKLNDMVLWNKTKAYAVPLWHPVGGIAINLKGRQPSGCVEPGNEYDAVCERIINELNNLRDRCTNGKIIVRACKREDLYTSKHIQVMPDIIFELADDYQLDIGLNYGPLVYNAPERLLNTQNGQHNMHGVLIAKGSLIKKGALAEGARIEDLAPTVLYGLGVPIPGETDGKILKDIFNPEFVEKTPVKYSEQILESQREKKHLTSREIDTIKKQLENLGYI